MPFLNGARLKTFLGWTDMRTRYDLANNLLGVLPWMFAYPTIRFIAEKSNPDRKMNLVRDITGTSLGFATFFTTRFLVEQGGRRLGVKNPALNYTVSLALGILARQIFQGALFNRLLAKTPLAAPKNYGLFTSRLPDPSPAEPPPLQPARSTPVTPPEPPRLNVVSPAPAPPQAVAAQPMNPFHAPMPVIPRPETLHRPPVFQPFAQPAGGRLAV